MRDTGVYLRHDDGGTDNQDPYSPSNLLITLVWAGVLGLLGTAIGFGIIGFIRAVTPPSDILTLCGMAILLCTPGIALLLGHRAARHCHLSSGLLSPGAATCSVYTIFTIIS
jgi:hypothetical protein